MSSDIVVVFRGAELLPHASALRSVYAEAFCAPPWNEDAPRATEFLERLSDDVHRSGFTAVTAVQHGRIVGFATSWTTGSPFPTDRCYPQVAAGLGPERTSEWLCGGREVDELAVRPDAQGTGVAARLLEAVAEGAPDDRAWLLTSVRSERAVSFYRRQSWTQTVHPSPGGKGIAVFLGPRHPARTLAPRPL